MSQLIHPTAIIDPDASLGNGVKVGPYSIIGPDVKIGDNSEIMHHVIVEKNTELGENTRLYPFCSIGTDPQDVTYRGEKTHVTIGKNNVIREFVQINRGTPKGGDYTRLGDDNFIMAYSHIAHDCRIGNQVVLINGATLAGHVEISDQAVIGAFSSVHQFVRIGRNAYIGGYTIVLQDILPYSKIAQTRDFYDFYGANAIGMRRAGLDRKMVERVRDMFDIIFRQDLNTRQAVERIEKKYPDEEEAAAIVDFINNSRRGLLKNFRMNKGRNNHQEK
jgi:UDP-N-acetylglucosamine acyltransferase